MSSGTARLPHSSRSSSSSSGLGLYSQAAHAGAATIIREYSTSFGMATRLLARQVRPDIENIYALVRVADEIVDGAATEAGVSAAAQRVMLDDLESETARAICDGYSANLVVHAFAHTARRAGIGDELIAPFFGSMRRDLGSGEFTAPELAEYIYGSAEVVGLMCLRVFLIDVQLTDEERGRLQAGARHLGAAFQKVNFLRDIAGDWGELGRCYFAGIDPATLTDSQKFALLRDIDEDLDRAAEVIPLLPRSCRPAIAAAHSLFSELSSRIARTPAQSLVRTRVRVPNARKLMIVLQSRSSRAVRASSARVAR